MLHDCACYTNKTSLPPIEFHVCESKDDIPENLRSVYALENAGSIALHTEGDVHVIYLFTGDRVDYDLGGIVVQFLRSSFTKDFISGRIFRMVGGSTKVRDAISIGWGLAQYSFDSHRSVASDKARPVLYVEDDKSVDHYKAIVEGLCLVKNMVNTAPNYMFPESLVKTAASVAKKFGAKIRIYKPEEVKAEFPLVYGVGQASVNQPYVSDLVWGDEKNPKITLVGKGVTFDTGGLDVKPVASMQLMKKDMAGAAHVLGLGYMIMALNLPIRLRVITPSAENSIGGKAMRPSDVLDSRSGKTVEIGNTDAEGRLLLADGITLATETEQPDLLVDIGTLTGGHSMGVEISAMMSNNDEIAQQLQKIGFDIDDKIWQLPLWSGYLAELSSTVADIGNNGTGRAGAIHVGLFLQEFLKQKVDWVHLDIFGWEAKGRPSRPAGGADYGIQALLKLIQERYC